MGAISRVFRWGRRHPVTRHLRTEARAGGGALARLFEIPEDVIGPLLPPAPSPARGPGGVLVFVDEVHRWTPEQRAALDRLVAASLRDQHEAEGRG